MKLSVFIGGIMAIVLSFVGVLLVSFYLPGQAMPHTIPAAYFQGSVFPEQSGPGLPVRLKIPSIKVDALMEYVGLTPDGAMDVPKNRDNVAWFEPGQVPGESGTAVIAGHYGRQYGKGSVFDNLYTLRKGDKVYIEDEKGAGIVFVVRESRRFAATADATDVFGSDDGGAHLNLITCEGAWDKSEQQYPSRLVVFTDKE